MSVPDRQNCSGVDCRTVSVMTRTVPRNSAADMPKNYPPSFGSTASSQRKCTCSICTRGNNATICPFQPALEPYKPSSENNISARSDAAGSNSNVSGYGVAQTCCKCYTANVREQPTKDSTKPLSLYTKQGNDHRRNRKPICGYRVDNDDASWNGKVTNDCDVATESPDVETITQTTETRIITAEQLENLLPPSNRYVLQEEGMQSTSEMGELGYQCPNVDCVNPNCPQLLANQRQAKQISKSSEGVYLCNNEVCQKENVCNEINGRPSRPSRSSITVARATHENFARPETESLSSRKQPVSCLEAQCAEQKYSGVSETRFKNPTATNPCCTKVCCKGCVTDETQPQTPKSSTVNNAYKDTSEVNLKSYREPEVKNQKTKCCTCSENVKDQPLKNRRSTSKTNTTDEDISVISQRSFGQQEVKNQKTKCCTCSENVKNQPITNEQSKSKQNAENKTESKKSVKNRRSTSKTNTTDEGTSEVSQKSYGEPDIKNQTTKCCTCPESVKNQPATNEQSKSKQNAENKSESVKNQPVKKNRRTTSKTNIIDEDTSEVSQNSYGEPEVKNQNIKCCLCPENVKNQTATNEQSKPKQNRENRRNSKENHSKVQSKQESSPENKPNSKENHLKEQSKKEDSVKKRQKKKEKCVIL